MARAATDDSDLPTTTGQAMSITKLGIVGSGIMGSGIAEVAAKSGIDVVLRSRKQETADAMVRSLEKSLARNCGGGAFDPRKPARYQGAQ